MEISSKQQELTENKDEIVIAQSKPKTNYIFKYSMKNKLVTGYNIACKSVDEIKQLKISELESEKQVRSGFVKFANERNDKVLNQLQEAKWVLRFPKGNSTINEAWKLLVELVENDILWDIKASALNDKFDTQIICVYIADAKNLHEIISVYDILLKNGLIKLHMEQEINNGLIKYITDESTRLHNCEYTYTNKDIVDLHKLFELSETVSEIMFKARWQKFVLALEYSKNNNGLLPEGFKTTYFSIEETSSRLELLERITTLQLDKKTAKLDPLENIVKQIRSTLTSNYKFTTVELLTYGISLIKEACPKQSFPASVFNKNPDIDKFKEVVKFFEGLVKNEELRLGDQARVTVEIGASI